MRMNAMKVTLVAMSIVVILITCTRFYFWLQEEPTTMNINSNNTSQNEPEDASTLPPGGLGDMVGIENTEVKDGAKGVSENQQGELPVYSLEGLEKMIDLESVSLEGVASNMTDPFGEEVPALNILITNRPEDVEGAGEWGAAVYYQKSMPVYIYGRTLWKTEELGKRNLVRGKFSRVIGQGGDIESSGIFSITDVNYVREINIDTGIQNGTESTIVRSACSEQGYVFKYPIIVGFARSEIVKELNVCRESYSWTGPHLSKVPDYFIETSFSLKPNGFRHTDKNPFDIYFDDRGKDIYFYLPIKTVHVKLVGIHEDNLPSMKKSIIESFQEWTATDEEEYRSQGLMI